MQYVCGELRDFLYCTRDHVSSSKVSDMENTAPSLDVSRKRKANVRDPHSDIGTKKKRPATRADPEIFFGGGSPYSFVYGVRDISTLI